MVLGHALRRALNHALRWVQGFALWRALNHALRWAQGLALHWALASLCGEVVAVPSGKLWAKHYGEH